MERATEIPAAPEGGGFEEIRLARDREYQRLVLPGVSRTFALTIPELPEPLRDPVTNAYLLCRIADTIEDHAATDAAGKQALLRQWAAVVAGRSDAADLVARLDPVLYGRAPLDEHDLVVNLSRFVHVTQSLPNTQRDAIVRCLQIMCEGMGRYQRRATPHGLPDRAAFDDYCYVVAGVVGEMLTELFCETLPELADQRDELMPLGRQFGLGLQTTNILKDVPDDRARGVFWLPRDVFAEAGCSLDPDADWPYDPAYREGVRRMTGLGATRLDAASAYILRLPPSQPGIRRFCTWAVAMAHATLRQVRRRPGFRQVEHVKIPRSQVRRLAALGRVAAPRQGALRLLLRWSGRGLPRAE